MGTRLAEVLRTQEEWEVGGKGGRWAEGGLSWTPWASGGDSWVEDTYVETLWVQFSIFTLYNVLWFEIFSSCITFTVLKS